MLDIVEIGAEVYEEMRCMADEVNSKKSIYRKKNNIEIYIFKGWTAEQQRYLAELAKHGFKARSAAGKQICMDKIVFLFLMLFYFRHAEN